MNSNRIIAALTLTLATISSFAGTAAPSSEHALSRAEVLAELSRARQAGEIGSYGDSDRSFSTSARLAQTSTLTRAQVLAELQRARNSGELAVNSELYGASLNVNTPSLRTRAEVLAEVRSGGFSRGDNQSSLLGN